jgi:hypothetical protein
MVKLSDEQAFAAAEYQLVRIDTGNVLMRRQLRGIDAEHFNRQWQERGVPTRWQRLNTAAVA